MWPVDRLQRQDGTPSDRPLVLAGRIGSRRVVTAVDVLAAGVGLRPGMPVSKAQALVPDLRIAPANVAEDLASLERLAFWILQRIAPIVAVDPPDGIVIDASGATHLHGGEDALLEALTGYLRATLPLVSGASGLPLWSFQLANVSSGLLWPFLLLSPGALSLSLW